MLMSKLGIMLILVWKCVNWLSRVTFKILIKSLDLNQELLSLKLKHKNEVCTFVTI